MKITKKKPLRPRGRTDEKRQSAKDAIRDAYANGPQREVQIIPAKRDLETGQPQKKLRVCAYCRVSTDEDTQASSYRLLHTVHQTPCRMAVREGLHRRGYFRHQHEKARWLQSDDPGRTGRKDPPTGNDSI